MKIVVRIQREISLYILEQTMQVTIVFTTQTMLDAIAEPSDYH